MGYSLIGMGGRRKSFRKSGWNRNTKTLQNETGTTKEDRKNYRKKRLVEVK